MINYLLKRVLMTILVLLVVTVFLAVLVHVVPAMPPRTMLGPRATPDLVAKIRSEMDLDKPAPCRSLTSPGTCCMGASAPMCSPGSRSAAILAAPCRIR